MILYNRNPVPNPDSASVVPVALVAPSSTSRMALVVLAVFSSAFLSSP